MRDPNLREWNKIKTIYTYHLNKCALLLVSKVCNKIHTTYISLVTAHKKTSQYTNFTDSSATNLLHNVCVLEVRGSAYWSHLKIK